MNIYVLFFVIVSFKTFLVIVVVTDKSFKQGPFSKGLDTFWYPRSKKNVKGSIAFILSLVGPFP